MDRKEIGCEVIDWILVAQNGIPWLASVKTVTNLLRNY
jgi:hypothetical protein